MTARILDGAAIAAAVRADVAADVAAYVATGAPRPHLSVVLVGDDPASHVYVRNKGRTCEEVGMTSETIEMPADATQQAVLDVVARLNADPKVSGILVQMPLPAHLDADAVLNSIDPRKDVDGLTPTNQGLLLRGTPGLVPATPAGVLEIMRRSDIDPAGQHAVVVGRSVLVGRPVAMLLANRAAGANATVTLAHTGTRDLGAVTRQADILIAAMGRPRAITADMVKPGATVIDVGINQIADPSRKSGTRLVGDVDFDAAKEVAGAITPVPGGVGPMTIAMLVVSTLAAARGQRAAG